MVAKPPQLRLHGPRAGVQRLAHLRSRLLDHSLNDQQKRFFVQAARESG
jgi:hypothetical protein